MSIKRPNAEEVADLAASLHMNMTVEEAAEYLSLMGGMFDSTTSSMSCRTRCRR